MTYFLPYFAQSYGEGAYGNCVFNATSAQLAACNGSSSSLVNTGLVVGGLVTLAAAILLISVLVRVWKRKKAKARAVKNNIPPESPTSQPPQVQG